MKLTVIFRGCYQDGVDHYSNYAITRSIKLTKEQEMLLTPPKGMTLSEVICEEEKDDAERYQRIDVLDRM